MSKSKRNKPVPEPSEISIKTGERDLNYRTITDNLPIIIWITDRDCQCVYLNNRWYEYTGKEGNYGLGFEWINMVHPEEKHQIEEFFLEANKNQVPFSFEYRLKSKDGSYRWHIDSSFPKYDEQGKFEGFTGSVIDIHERKLAEEALHKNEQWYKTYAEAMPQMAFIADAQGNIVYYNQRWYDFIGGLKGTERWGWKEFPIHHPDDLQRTIDKWGHSLRTGEPYEIEYRLRRFDGQYIWHLGRATSIKNNEGKIELWFGTNTDIHKQKQTEEALKESEERFRLVSKATNDAVWDWDLLNNELWWNETTFALFGYKREEVGEYINWWNEHLHPDDKNRVLSGIHEAIEKGANTWSDEYRFLCADGTFVEILDRGYIIHDKSGKPVRMLGSMLDITERIHIEKALIFEREKLKAIIENMGVGVGLTDNVGNTISLNKAALKIHGFDSETEMLSKINEYKKLFQLQYPDGKELPFNKWPSIRAISGEVVHDYEVKLINTLKKSHKYVSYTAVPLLDDKGEIMNFIFTITDLTERIEAEAKLNFQKSLYEAQQEVSPLGILVVSSEGKMLTFNKRMAEMWHFSNQIMNTEMDEVALNAAKEQLIDPDAFIEKVLKCYQHRQQNHEKLFFKDGRIFERYGSPITGMHGTYYGYVWYFMDITENENLARQKDDFLGIASHELKTPVAIMKGYINLLERILQEKSAETEVGLLKKADLQINRLTNLINDLLDVTKIESGKMRFDKKEFDFDQLVDEVVESLQHVSTHKLVRIGKTGKTVVGDKDRTGQVINNFITNAINYSPKNSEIIVGTSEKNGEVTLIVEDFGIGIAPEDLLKVFDRFYRVRSGGNKSTGLGLGLFISSEIIKRQGGRIWVESEVGRGSNFSFTLPVLD